MTDSSSAYEKLAVRALLDAATELPVPITKLQQTIINPYCKKIGQEVLTWKNTTWRSLSEFVYHLESQQYISIQGTKIVKILSRDPEVFQEKENKEVGVEDQGTRSQTATASATVAFQPAGKENSPEDLKIQSKRRRTATMDGYSYTFDKELSDITNLGDLESLQGQAFTPSSHQASLQRSGTAPPNDIVYIDDDHDYCVGGAGGHGGGKEKISNSNIVKSKKSDFSVWLKQQAIQQGQSTSTLLPSPTFPLPQLKIAPNSNESSKIINISTPSIKSAAKTTATPVTTTTTTTITPAFTEAPPLPLVLVDEKSAEIPSCPVCGIALPGMNETQIGHHVDECLTRDFLEEETEQQGKLENDTDGDDLDTDSYLSGAPTFVCPYPGCHIPTTSLTALQFGKHVADMHRNDENQCFFCPICRFIGEEDTSIRMSQEGKKSKRAAQPTQTPTLHLWRHLNSIHQDIMLDASSHCVIQPLFSSNNSTKASPSLPISLPQSSSSIHPHPLLLWSPPTTATTTTTTTTVSPPKQFSTTATSTPHSPTSPSSPAPSFPPSLTSNSNASTSTIYKINKFIDSLGNSGADKQRDNTKLTTKPNNTTAPSPSLQKYDSQLPTFFGGSSLLSPSHPNLSCESSPPIQSGDRGGASNLSYPASLTPFGSVPNFGTFGATNTTTITSTTVTSTIESDSSLYIDYELNSDWKDRECTICFEDFLRNQRLARMQCMCVFHKHCLDLWFLKKRHCPLHTCN